MSKISNAIKSCIPVITPKYVRQGAKNAIEFEKKMVRMRTDCFKRRFASTQAGYFPERQSGFFQNILNKFRIF